MRATHVRGFTLVELLVVIAIIGVLVGLLLPAVQAARESGRRMSCTNNLKQVGLAIANHESARKVFPKGRDTRSPGGEPEGDPPRLREAYSWAFRVLPFMEQQAIFDAYVPTVPVYDAANSKAWNKDGRKPRKPRTTSAASQAAGATASERKAQRQLVERYDDALRQRARERRIDLPAWQ